MPDGPKNTNKNPEAEIPAGPPPKQTPPGFLKDGNGKPSSMRLMCFLALFASIWFGWMTLHSNVASQNGVYITSGFLLAAFAPKALQKFIEEYYPK